jgi:hypothetical protein
MGVSKRSAGIETEIHRPGINLAGEDKLNGAFLRKLASVFRDQVTLNGMKSSYEPKFYQEENL